MAVRCKVVLNERYDRNPGMQTFTPPHGEKGPAVQRYFVFNGVFSDDPESENKMFQEASPSIEFKLGCSNPAVDFEPGREYYLDIVKAYSPRDVTAPAAKNRVDSRLTDALDIVNDALAAIGKRIVCTASHAASDQDPELAAAEIIAL
jgi:hypothetical protein